MLYLTTRDKFDTFTVPHVLRSSRANNGGYFLPFRLPTYTPEDLTDLQEIGFGQCVAKVLNSFFSCGITGWDVEFAIGRYPVKVKGINQRVWVGELWHNQENDYANLERVLGDRLGCTGEIPSWVKIAIRIAALLSTYAQMLKEGAVTAVQSFDVALPTGDFTAVMAAWYARKMGVPITNIVCGCNENSAVWELLHLGELRTDVQVVNTALSAANIAVPEELERLIHGTLGVEEVLRYREMVLSGGVFSPRPGMLDVLRAGFFAAVVSESRLEALIPSVYRTSGYVMGPYTALAYGALQDYRAKTGESRDVLILVDKSPVRDSAFVSRAMNISRQELEELLKKD